MLSKNLKISLVCEHDSAKLKEEKTNAGTIYRCPKCNCTFRLAIAVNDNKCWQKRFPVKKK